MPDETTTDPGVSRWTTTRIELIEALRACDVAVGHSQAPATADVILSRLTPVDATEAGPVQRLREIADHDIGGSNPALADVVNAIASVLAADLRLFFAKLGGTQFLDAGSEAGAAEGRLRRAAVQPDEFPAESLADTLTGPAELQDVPPDVTLRILPARWEARAADLDAEHLFGGHHLSACADELREVLAAIDGDTADLVAAILEQPQDPPLPPGEYARVEILGHDQLTGWVTDGNRAGQPVMVVRDWNGLVIAEVPGHSLYRFVPLATPLKRPGPPPERPALTSGSAWDYDNDGEGPLYGGGPF